MIATEVDRQNLISNSVDEIVNNEYAVKSEMSNEGETYSFRFHS